MHWGLKVLIGAFATLGGSIVASLIASRYITVALYSPSFPKFDIYTISGRDLWGLLAKGGGKSKPKESKGLPIKIPLAVRLYWGERPRMDVGREAYKSIFAKPMEKKLPAIIQTAEKIIGLSDLRNPRMTWDQVG